MFTLAVFVGIYSYLIFGLGLIGLLTRGWILGVTVIWLLSYLVTWFVNNSPLHPSLKLREGTRGRVTDLLLLSIVFQAVVNLVGALGPELGFDALWYHLTLPKLWLEAGKIFDVSQIEPRLYYAVMPHLGETLFAAALALGNEVWAKLIQWAAGILTTVITYRLARHFVQQKWAMLAAAVFYSNLVVGWQSTTAYVDLVRTFFEVLALYLLVNKQIFRSAVVLGLVMATKTLAIGSFGILGAVVWLEARDLGKLVKFGLVAILVAAPWYVFAYLNTGNLVYPVFSNYPLEFAWRDVNLLRLADPINPVYVVVLPMIFMWLLKISPSLIPPLNLRGGKREGGDIRLLLVYSGLSLVVWYLTPRTGGGRFLLPYLPAWSVATAVVTKRMGDKVTQNFVVGIVVAIAVISIGYRAAANVKYLPVIFGWQDKLEFIRQNLNVWEKAGNLYYEGLD